MLMPLMFRPLRRAIDYGYRLRYAIAPDSHIVLIWLIAATALLAAMLLIWIRHA